MEKWKELEFDYARRLRSGTLAERRELYGEAYTAVYTHLENPSELPEERTAGTSPALVELLLGVLGEEERVLEVGCGRGYTCLMLAPYVAAMVGTDVSETALAEARAVLAQYGRSNATVYNVSAFDLDEHFAPEQFSTVVSIEVVEHLHPQDAEEHYRQVLRLLQPGGRYIIVMPNRLNGPHDITREEYPALAEAIGFHLNESTYREMGAVLTRVGYTRLCSFHPLRLGRLGMRPFFLPHWFNLLTESLYHRLPASLRLPLLEKLIGIRLMAFKPGP
jgi:SAM-dependent methyltransferase